MVPTVPVVPLFQKRILWHVTMAWIFVMLVSALALFAMLWDWWTVSALQNASSAMFVVWIVQIWRATLHLICLELLWARPDLPDILATTLRASVTAMESKLQYTLSFYYRSKHMHRSMTGGGDLTFNMFYAYMKREGEYQEAKRVSPYANTVSMP